MQVNEDRPASSGVQASFRAAISPLQLSQAEFDTALGAQLSPARIMMPSGLVDIGRPGTSNSSAIKVAGLPSSPPMPSPAAGAVDLEHTTGFHEDVLQSRVETMWAELKVALDRFQSKGLIVLHKEKSKLLVNLMRVQQSFMEDNKTPIRDTEHRMTKEERLARAREAGIASVMSSLSTVSSGAEVASKMFGGSSAMQRSSSTASFARDGLQSPSTPTRASSGLGTSMSAVELSFSPSKASLTSTHTSVATLHAVTSTVRAQAECFQAAASTDADGIVAQAAHNSQELVELCLAQFRYGLMVIIDVARDHIAWLKRRNEVELRDMRVSINQQVTDMLTMSRADIRDRLMAIHDRHAMEFLSIQRAHEEKLSTYKAAYKSMSSQVRELKGFNDALRDCILAIGSGAGISTAWLVSSTTITVTILPQAHAGDDKEEVEASDVLIALSEEDKSGGAKSPQKRKASITGPLTTADNRRASISLADASNNNASATSANPNATTSRIVRVVAIPDRQAGSGAVAAIVTRIQQLMNLEKEHVVVQEKLASSEARAHSWEENAKEARYALVLRESEVRDLTDEKQALSMRYNEAKEELTSCKDMLRISQSIIREKDAAVAAGQKEKEKFARAAAEAEDTATRATALAGQWQAKAEEAAMALDSVQRQLSALQGDGGLTGRRRSSVSNIEAIAAAAVRAHSEQKPREAPPVAVTLPSPVKSEAALAVFAADRGRIAAAMKRVALPSLARLAAQEKGGRNVIWECVHNQADVREGRRRALSTGAALERLAMRGEERRGKERGGEERREEATHEEVRDNTGQSVPDRLSVVSLESSLHSSMAAELTRCRIALHFAQAEHTRMAATHQSSQDSLGKLRSEYERSRDMLGDIEGGRVEAVKEMKAAKARAEELSTEVTRLQAELAAQQAMTASLAAGEELQLHASPPVATARPFLSPSLSFSSMPGVSLPPVAGTVTPGVASSEMRGEGEGETLVDRLQQHVVHMKAAVQLHVDTPHAVDAPYILALLEDIQASLQPSNITSNSNREKSKHRLKPLRRSHSYSAMSPFTSRGADMGWETTRSDASSTEKERGGEGRGEERDWQVKPTPFGSITRKRRASAPAGAISKDLLVPASLRNRVVASRGTAAVESDAIMPLAPLHIPTPGEVQHGWLLQSPIGPIFVPMHAATVGIPDASRAGTTSGGGNSGTGAYASLGHPTHPMRHRHAVLPKVAPDMTDIPSAPTRQSRQGAVERPSLSVTIANDARNRAAGLEDPAAAGKWFDPKTAIPIPYEDLIRSGMMSPERYAAMVAAAETQSPSSRTRLRPFSQPLQRSKSRDLAIARVLDVVLGPHEEHGSTDGSHMSFDASPLLPSSLLPHSLVRTADSSTRPSTASSDMARADIVSRPHRGAASVSPARPSGILSRPFASGRISSAKRLPPLDGSSAPPPDTPEAAMPPLPVTSRGRLPRRSRDNAAASNTVWPLGYTPLTASDEAAPADEGRDRLLHFLHVHGAMSPLTARGSSRSASPAPLPVPHGAPQTGTGGTGGATARDTQRTARDMTSMPVELVASASTQPLTGVLNVARSNLQLQLGPGPLHLGQGQLATSRQASQSPPPSR